MAVLNYYLGPWVVGNSGWENPPGVVGGMDLRSIPTQSINTFGDKPNGFFAVNGILGSEYTLLASGDMREINSTAVMKSAWLAMHGYSPEGDKLVDLLWDHLTVGGDVTGDARSLPLVPTVQGNLELFIGGHSLVRREPFQWGVHSHTMKLKDLLQRELLDIRTQAQAGQFNRPLSGGGHIVDHEYHRRIMQAMLDKYRIDFEDIRPINWPVIETPLPHSTIFTESFNKADSDTLGPDQPWTETVGDIDIVSNKASLPTKNVLAEARCDTDLSSSDHYGEVIVVTLNDPTSNNTIAVVCSRWNSSVRTYYFLHWDQGTANNIRARKRLSGSSSDLVLATPAAVTKSIPDTIKFESNGSTQKIFFNGAEKDSVTDTAIVTGTRVGISGFIENTGAVNDLQYDTFEGADLAVAGRIMSSLVNTGGLVGMGGIAGRGGGLAG